MYLGRNPGSDLQSRLPGQRLNARTLTDRQTDGRTTEPPPSMARSEEEEEKKTGWTDREADREYYEDSDN